VPETTKSAQLFFTTDDEAFFSHLLLSAIPDIHFLDGCVWPSVPTTATSIDQCQSNLCYLFSGSIQNLPVFTRPDGRIQGAQSGCVIQVMRSLRQEDLLRSGSIGIGYEKTDVRISSFVNTTWKLLKKVTTLGVVRPDQNVDRHYLVGHIAAREAREGRLRLRDRSVDIFYSPL
jgi:hypothetical protein